MEFEEQSESILNYEDITYLGKTIDFMEYYTLLKKFNAPYQDNIVASIGQYSKQTDSKMKMLRFGMLCTDIAYMRIIGKVAQTNGYDELYDRYIKDLDLASVFPVKYFEYMKEITDNEINDEFFNKMKDKIRKDRIEFIERSKKINEEFLIYFTIGNLIEQLYISENINQTDSIRIKLNEYIKENGYPFAYLFKKIWERTYKNESNRAVQEYALKLKPIYENLIQKVANNKSYPDEEIVTKELTKMANLIVELRTEMLR